MALTNDNTLDIAYKKLVGKTHTSSGFLSSQEENGTFAQLDVSKVFGQVIPSLATDAVNQGIAEAVTLYLKGDSRSQYDESGEGLGTHAFNLYTDVALTTPFQGNIIPDSFGSSYAPDLKTNTDEKVDKLSNHNWTFDASSAVVWFQNTSVDPKPINGWKITVYRYIGKSLSETISESGGGAGESSHTTITHDQTDLNIDTNNIFLLDATSNNIIIKLPLASHNEKKTIVFKRVDGNSSYKVCVMGKQSTSTPIPGGSSVSQIEYIDDIGSSNFSASIVGQLPDETIAKYIYVQYETLTLYCDGIKWHII